MLQCSPTPYDFYNNELLLLYAEQYANVLHEFPVEIILSKSAQAVRYGWRGTFSFQVTGCEQTLSLKSSERSRKSDRRRSWEWRAHIWCEILQSKNPLTHQIQYKESKKEHFSQHCWFKVRFFLWLIWRQEWHSIWNLHECWDVPENRSQRVAERPLSCPGD